MQAFCPPKPERLPAIYHILFRGIKMKKCNKCGVEKPLQDFEKAKWCKDGRRSTCRKCKAPDAAKRAAKWRELHPDRAVEANAKWLNENPQKRKDVVRRHYLRNKDSILERRKENYARDPEKYANAAKKWLAANRDTRTKSSAAWRSNNRDKIAIYNRKWDESNPDARRTINQNRRARLLGNSGRLSKGLRAKLFEKQNGLCACCGVLLGDNYHMDHIIPLSKGGENKDENMQLLRARCNLQKKDKHPDEFMRQRAAGVLA